MKIEIDEHSGFCFGVVTAIKKAEEELSKGGVLYCLGDIVHNGSEVKRLEEAGLVTIDHEQFAKLHDVKVLLRAHGEPPATYEMAKRNNITLIDATCPVVLMLQKRIKTEYDTEGDKSRIVIFGKKGHAEVNGLVGQTDNKAIVIESPSEVSKVGLDKDISLFSQTTKPLDEYNEVAESLREGLKQNGGYSLKFNDTICRQVANRIPNIFNFAKVHDLIIFVSGKKSSNGKSLFAECHRANERSYFISSADELEAVWFADDVKSIGVCGATSTPKWLMEKVADRIKEIITNN
ncbi:MAG: 4-hydroxy-3-methylbut-2-enyl diphosphate reductase [Paludibacteraceae bacterium]|nr:4-hydroxy-3-methylbut-2-enyl diphosphate reductase [Bacteroidales bacterium]MBP3467386.1 4-hydroxy-3-methylbut-2-enyl diphosphate reductase [Paludibacteraceae bacterium]MBQ1835812.1 4-hydroxy-3-methylbut-2-enyl diphosphate reductase [Paludibacteraceae bacterium]MBQ2051733.1 4-hydroxy-3-methylbut-2-enyl diphosphate reductase [Paludibacteraceae bacterium]MBQ2591399.1 4-hydroxy-3-methylbut-2-enyl diphosphate reductase [Paludibacteraceae bacterium]